MENLRLPNKERLLLEHFIGKLSVIYGSDLISVVLYGSAASGEFTQKHSNINVLVVLRDTGLPMLAKASALVSSSPAKKIDPIFFSESYIATSPEVFPIEFLDMKENYAVLYGKDVLRDIRIDTRNLRFQCEQELKSRLITIKRQYMRAGGRKNIERLLFASFTSCVHILRNLLRLKGIEPPYAKNEVLSEVEKEFSVDVTVLNEILWARTKDMRLSHADADALLIGLVKELEAIIAIVDAL